ncbi:hypothetical protein QVD99_006002 [Batrachochytrium dendrobatidis]|nr:hypothetical protein O5D80_006190 [Batrachochytrium dendrobatidis]KAK5667401.1 hypothetical protein QVD99_006002 [Batrachochytrium dendrobatidis]
MHPSQCHYQYSADGQKLLPSRSATAVYLGSPAYSLNKAHQEPTATPNLVLPVATATTCNPNPSNTTATSIPPCNDNRLLSRSCSTSLAKQPVMLEKPDYSRALASLCTCFMGHVWPSPSLVKSSTGITNYPGYPQAPMSPPAEQLSPVKSSPMHMHLPTSQLDQPLQSISLSSTSFTTFVHQLVAITRAPAETIIVSLKYLFMLRQRYPGNVENAGGSEYRLFVTALILAHKMMDDTVCSLKAWSKITSISVAELSQMEFEFISALNFDLHVSAAGYQTWCSQLECFLAIARKNEEQLLEQQHHRYQQLSAASTCNGMTLSACELSSSCKTSLVQTAAGSYCLPY